MFKLELYTLHVVTWVNVNNNNEEFWFTFCYILYDKSNMIVYLCPMGVDSSLFIGSR